ncbi:MAG: MBL fold metallo-hydrolase [Clostridiales bacterium]|jgi:beta-lactamase superfamily II metal-dependent hydrolase|nr:MBL fold metallo-hydrolase [Clostridiales bacterium]
MYNGFNRFKNALIVFYIAFALASCYNLAQTILHQGEAVATFIDVGQGDSEMITTPQGRRVLIDSGNDDSTASNEASVIKYLRANGINKVDVATISHYDGDHAGGMKFVVYEFDVELLILPMPITDDDFAMRDEILASTQPQTKVVYVKGEGEQLKIGDEFIAEVLRCNVNAKDDNERSIVLKATCFDTKMMFTGDMGIDAESDMLGEYASEVLDVDIAKVAHHGSKYSSSLEFYEAMTPQYAVIEVGSNMYGHPTVEAMDRIKASGAEVLTTKDKGSINFYIDKGEYRYDDKTIKNSI